MTQNQKAWLKSNMKTKMHVTNSDGTKTLKEAMRAVNPADMGYGPDLKTSPGSVKHVDNMKNAK